MLAETAEGFLVSYRLVDPAISFEALTEADPAKLDIIRRELSRPAFAVITPQGRILSVWCDPAIHELSRDFLKAALAITQFVVPGSTGSSKLPWQIEEEDPNGRYIARYEPILDRSYEKNTPRLFRKVKLRYLPSPSTKLRNGVYEVKPSVTTRTQYTAGFDFRKGCLVSLEGSETQQFAVAGNDVGKSKITLGFRLVKSEAVAPVELQSLLLASADRRAAQAGAHLSDRQFSETTETAFQRQYLGAETLASFLTAFEKSETAGGESETQLYLKARALIYLQPEMSDRLGQLLAAADTGSRGATVLTSALGAVGHSEAQAALMSAIKAHLGDERMRQRLFRALAECEVPSESTQQALRELMDNGGSAEAAQEAAQILGAMTRKLGATSPQRASQLIDLLIQDLAASTDPASTKSALLALGATGSERALSHLEPFLHALEADIRITAVVALQSYDNGAADALLLQIVQSDPVASVRLESVLALAERVATPRSFEIQRKLFSTEKDAGVRLALLHNLWQARNGFPQAIRLVKRAANHDASKNIQQAARTLLSDPS